MTDQFTALTPAAIREIVGHLERSIAVFEQSSGRMTAAELQVKSMLTTLRRQLVEQLARQERGDRDTR